MTKKRARRRSIRTARHEAAHAVVGEFLGVRVKTAHIFPHGKVFGQVEFDDGCRATYLSQAIYTCAGCAAEWKWHRMSQTSMTNGDLKMFRFLFPKAVDRMAIAAATGRYIDHLREPILDVADALRERDLTGREIRKIMRATGFKPGRAIRDKKTPAIL